MQDLQRTARQIAPDLAEGDAPAGDLGQLIGREEDLRPRPQFHAEEIGQRDRQTIEDLLQRADRGAGPILLDQGDDGVGHARAPGECALGEPMHQAKGAKPGPDIDVLAHRDCLSRSGYLTSAGPECTITKDRQWFGLDLLIFLIMVASAFHPPQEPPP
jgi:hypothetical protein